MNDKSIKITIPIGGVPEVPERGKRAEVIKPVAIAVPTRLDPLARPPKIPGKGPACSPGSAKRKPGKRQGAHAGDKTHRNLGPYARPGRVSRRGSARSLGSAKRKAGQGHRKVLGRQTSQEPGSYDLPPNLLDVKKYLATKVQRSAVPFVPKGAFKVGSEPFSVAS